MSCFCVRGFGGRLGFLSFWGCSGLSAVFSRVRGSSGFSLLLASLRFGRGEWGGGLSGGFSRVRGWVRPVLLLLLVGGGLGASGASGSCVFVRGVGCVCAWFLLPVGVGVGCAWFPVSCSRWFSVVFAEGFPGVFVSARRFLALVWGVSGWVGVVFSPAVLLGPGLFRVRVLVLFGEFDPGSGRTLAACLTHASRTRTGLRFLVEWRTGE